MDRSELLEKIGALPPVAGLLTEDFLAGDFGSILKGQGIEFDEVRRYERGDDVRSIDRNVSARFGTPYVKMYREEREMTILLLLDGSSSMFAVAGGKNGVNRYEQALIAGALIAFSAERAGQRLGALVFGPGIIRLLPPRKGKTQSMAFINAALEPESRRRGSGLGAALTGADRLLKRRSLIVVISDFLCVDWEQEFQKLSRRHDVIALCIRDPLDRELPPGGLVIMEDPETGDRLYAPTGFSRFRSAWAEWKEERARLWESICRRSGAAPLELSTDEDASAVLLRFFSERRRR
ncbi:MAG: DUF58 domain-containing protein [Treponema sp.]|jgi:uncharacterized protein (DUF58 family)|nr:DUF58 domain-containing protein [Treponema sp.]